MFMHKTFNWMVWVKLMVSTLYQLNGLHIKRMVVCVFFLNWWGVTRGGCINAGTTAWIHQNVIFCLLYCSLWIHTLSHCPCLKRNHQHTFYRQDMHRWQASGNCPLVRYKLYMYTYLCAAFSLPRCHVYVSHKNHQRCKIINIIMQRLINHCCLAYL